MDVPDNFCDAEKQFIFEVREICKMFGAKIFLANFLLGQYLLEILNRSLTLKNIFKCPKSGCFEKLLKCRAPISFGNERKM